MDRSHFTQGDRMNPDPGFSFHALQCFPGKESEFLGKDLPLFRGEDDLGQKYGKRAE
jgi:hypothetical protein